MSEANLKEILSRRQKVRSEIVNVDEPTVTLVIFSLGGDWFAFPGKNIREIFAHADVFFVPGCPPSLEGVMNVRGDIESVFRLHDLLQIKIPAETDKSVILLGKTETMKSGIRVDQVLDVAEVTQSAIQPPPANLPDQIRFLASGVLRFRDLPVTVLELEKIFHHYLQGIG